MFGCVYHMLVEVRKGHRELEMVVSCRAGAGDPSWVFWKNSNCF